MISFLMVIVIHVTNYFCRAYGRITEGEYIVSLILDTAARLSVPCFFMISGALLLGREEPLDKHWKRLKRFGTALVVWSLIYYFWNRFFMGTPYDLTRILYEPTEAHLWYLYAMIPIYLVLPFFQIMCRGMNVRMERAFLFVICAAVLFNYIVSLQHGEAYYDLPLIGDRVYSFYLFIGYYLYKYWEQIRLSQKTVLAVCILALGSAAALTWAVTVSTGEHYERVLEYGCPLIVAAAAAFFLFMLRAGNGSIHLGDRVRRVVDLCCSCSFGIYLIHILFLDSYKKYVEADAFCAWAAVPLLTAGIVTASFLCIWGMRRFRLGRKIT